MNTASTLLVVDGDAASRSETVRVLESLACDVAEASDGLEALAQCHAIRPDVVLLDVALPDGPGLDVLQQIRADPSLVGVSIVLTGDRQVLSDQREAWLEAGADDYIVQPTTDSLLVSRVRWHLRQRQGSAHELAPETHFLVRNDMALDDPVRDAATSGIVDEGLPGAPHRAVDDTIGEGATLRRIAGRVARLGGWTIDLPEQNLTWSDEVCEIHDVPAGYTPTLEEGIKLFPPEVRDEVIGYVMACAREGTPYDYELPKLTATGRRIWVRGIGEAVRDAKGRIIRVQGAFQDITKQKASEEAHRRLTEELATTLESITDGFYTVDREWRFTYVNAEAERMLKRRRSELIGVSVWDAFPEAAGSIFEREYRRALADGVTVDFEEYFAPLESWFQIRAYPSERGLAVYFLDVTSTRDADRALRNSEERFRLLSKATSDVMWDRDLVTGTQSWNEGVTSLFGYSPEEIDAAVQFSLDRVHPDDIDALKGIVEYAVSRGADNWAAEYRFQRKDGGYTPVLDSGYIIRDSEGNAIRMLGGMKDRTEWHRVEESLRLRDRAIQEVSQGILITDANQPDNPIVYASDGVERITGYRRDEVLGRSLRMFDGKDTAPDAVDTIRAAIEAGRGCEVEILSYRKNGTPFWNAMSLNPVRDDSGTLSHFVGMLSDMTEHRNLEGQLRQSQKMEAVGRLAGGVAHDFNNLLTVITGYSDLVFEMPEATERVREAVQPIREAGERAAALTRQLLGFSRQTVLQPKVLDLNTVVVEIGRMLRRLIGEDIDFTVVLEPALHRVKVDPTQLDQVLMNLAVNARDAMPTGGRLTVETANVVPGHEVWPTSLDCTSGPHVVLSISDTGCGMTPEVLARIFEPFFTTKEVGEGSGLGLPMVFGIVEQSGGCVNVFSEPGVGTTFRVYFPAVAETVAIQPELHRGVDHAGSETILLVEDEDGVRALALMILSEKGYTVLPAVDGRDALNVVEAHVGLLDLVLTDVVMPRMGGPEMVRALMPQFPGVKVLFMSGYTDDAVVRHGLLEADVSFIQKPYTPTGLAKKVREVLDAVQ